ncbi:unnamed protein product [Mytilus coruscus]|uniref:ISXO2-like transposase domain-containing protein n=1 Tax=Mytilus coruscus TaxID=42192 RepID=A0A6J8DAV6_MYTCO|nr:unnamed protein product [Mytilus coruscus]
MNIHEISYVIVNRNVKSAVFVYKHYNVNTEMPIKLKDLFIICESIEKIIQWCISIGLILDLTGEVCKKCSHGHFGLRKDSSFSNDIFYWKCSNKKCSKKVSIRNGSWFQGHNLSLEKILFITYFWIYKIDQEFVKHELSICNQTIVDWYNYCREVCIEILKIDSEKIGGDSVIVEIDESKFGKRKYHKGRQVEGQWVFGGIERDSKKSFFATVENRTKETLLKLIKDNIKPGTTIISDCWKAYNCLGSEGFEHLKVNHSVNCVDPETGAHTNTIESTWRALKKSLPKYGTVKSLYDTYFSQYCVRKKYIIGSEDPFIAFITLIKKVYNPEKQKQTLITTENITISEPQPATKKPRVLHEIKNTLNSSLDDFQA